jgi:CHAT domain-containing protein
VLVAKLPTAQFVHLATHGFAQPVEVKQMPAVPANGFLTAIDRPVRGSQRNPLTLVALAASGANEAHNPDSSDVDDGLLTGEEVAELDLSNTELVVLSACETGLGDSAGGEGVFGLQRAFEQAGARTTIASLWKVSDDPTRALMERFYENLWNKKLGRLESLREAQLWMYEHGSKQAGIRRDAIARGAIPVDEPETTDRRLPPYYWGAFVLSGDWR